MRSIVLLLATLLVAVAGFVTYRAFQTATPRLAGAGGTEAVATAVAVHGTTPHLGQIHEGDRPWIRNIDRLGRLASRFKADEYLPQGGGRVHVIHPQAEFFQYPVGRQQRIYVEAETGDIEVQEPSGGSGQSTFEKGSSGPPKRGRLKNNVRVKLFPDALGPHRDTPSIILVTDNMTFDNETFEISTAATTDRDGKVIPADEVPIAVTGDYEFQGKGLKLRWNDLDGRLEYLEVAHGDYLTVLHPGGTSMFGAGEERDKGAAGPRDTPPPQAPPPPPAPAPPAADPATVSVPALGRPHSGARPAPVKPHHGPQPPYLATFDNDVRVSQGERDRAEKQLATAETMTIDFLLNQPKDPPQAATRPATAPATAPAPPPASSPDTGPAAPAGQVAAAPPPAGEPATGGTPAGGPTTGPSTRPSDPNEAVTVRWAGKLHVVPIEGPSPSPLRSGESLVHLIGGQSPVHVTRDANDVRCARLDYRSPDGTVALYNSPAFPRVVVRQLGAAPAAPGAAAGPPPDEAVITTEAIDYSGAERVAVLHGDSEARVRMKPDPADPAGPAKPGELDVRWQRLARIYFLDRAAPGGPGAAAAHRGGPGAAGRGPEQLAVDHAHFEGDVDVRHPQLALKSQTLDATFDPSAAAPPAREAGPAAAVDAAASASAAAPATRPAGPGGAGQTNLRRLVATEAVTCQVTDEAGKKQNVECQQMVMDTAFSPAGKLYPKKIDFDGDARADAHAFDPTQDLRAGHIEATFSPPPAAAPATAPAADALVAADGAAGGAPAPAAPTTRSGPATRPAEIDTVTATDRVRITTADGALATADRLFVKMVEGSPHARLSGTPAGPGTPPTLAKVVDAKKNVIIGPVITADPKQNVAAVEGPGTMHLIRQESPKDTPRPIDVAFKSGAVMNSPENVIDVREAVSVVSTDPDGTVNTANGQHVRILLADKPPEAPATRPARPDPAGKPDPSGSSDPARKPDPAGKSGPATAPAMDAMKGKVVTGVLLEKEAVVRSGLTDPRGAVLREFELKSELIRYELGSTQPGAKGRIIVPVPGRMLIRDHRPPAAPAAGGAAPAGGAAAANPADPGQNRGATAFQWSRDLTYDEATYTAVLTGDVWIVHLDDEPKAEPARLRADRVVAVFEPKANPAAKPVVAPGAPAGTSGDPASNLQLRSMTATGNVSVTRAGSTLNAPRMDYSPVTGWMNAVGTPREPAAYVDAAGVNSCTARQIDWNAQTWNVRFKDIISRTGRR